MPTVIQKKSSKAKAPARPQALTSGVAVESSTQGAGRPALKRPAGIAVQAPSGTHFVISPWEAMGKVFEIGGVRDEYTAARAIERGLRPAIVTMLEAFIGPDYRRMLIPDRTLARRVREGDVLTADEGNKVLLTAHVVTLAIQVFGSEEKAQRWLRSPKKRFDGRAPLDVVAHSGPGAIAVEQMLGQIGEGFFA